MAALPYRAHANYGTWSIYFEVNIYQDINSLTNNKRFCLLETFNKLAFITSCFTANNLCDLTTQPNKFKKLFCSLKIESKC